MVLAMVYYDCVPRGVKVPQVRRHVSFNIIVFKIVAINDAIQNGEGQGAIMRGVVAILIAQVADTFVEKTGLISMMVSD